MKPQNPDDKLEQLLHRHLRELPQPAAPPELISNVLKQIAERQNRVWWKSPWPEWPRGMRILSSLALALALGVVWCYTPNITAGSTQLGAWLTGRLHFVKPVWTVAEALFGAAQVLVSSIKPQFLIIGGMITALSYLGVIGLATLFYRVAADSRPNF